MVDSIQLTPSGPLSAAIRPPGSKSITNRALVCAALARGTSHLTGVLFSDDTHAMIDSLRRLDIAVRVDEECQEIEVDGCDHRVPATEARLMCDNSGTTIRFLTAVCTSGNGHYVLDGSKRMRERPIGALVNALNQLGANVECEGGFPPVTVHGRGLRGGVARVQSSQSSQFLSAVLMVLPCAREYSVIQAAGGVVSRPYINLTCQVMRKFGVDVLQLEEAAEYSVDPRHRYRGTDFEVEPDATAASYCWAAAAIAGGSVRVEGIPPDSAQGDVRFARVLEEMGCSVFIDDRGITVSGPADRPVSLDMGDISDTVQTLAAVALFVPGTTVIRGVAHNRLKETDRIGNLATELRKLGATVDERPDGLAITSGLVRPARIETWNDHRMAMALSLAGLRQPGVEIMDPGCVSKTWPDYFERMRDLTRPAGDRNGTPPGGNV